MAGNSCRWRPGRHRAARGAVAVIAGALSAAPPALGVCSVTTMLGCFVDPDNARILSGWHDFGKPTGPMDYDYCAQDCHDLNFTLAGVEDGQQCFCGDAMHPAAPPRSSRCTAPCISNTSEKCGGDNAMTVYRFRCVGAPTPGRPAAPPTLGAISPRLLAVELQQAVTVEGRRLNSSHNSSAIAVCRWTPAGGASWSARGGFVSNLTIINDTHGTCMYTPSSGGPVVGGPGGLSISSNGETFSNALDFTFANVASVAFGRFPYIDETEGQLLLDSDARFLGGRQLNVTAAVPAVPTKTWAWTAVQGGSGVTLPLDFDGVPARVHNDMMINISLSRDDGGTTVITRWRRFMRVPPPAADSTVESVQLDAERAGLRVAGVPFLSRGWFVNTPYPNETTPNAGGLVALLGRLAKADLLNNVTVQTDGPYPPVVNSAIVTMVNWPVDQQLHVLDGAHRFGVKLILSLCRMGIDGGTLSNQSKHEIRGNVSISKNHP